MSLPPVPACDCTYLQSMTDDFIHTQELQCFMECLADHNFCCKLHKRKPVAGDRKGLCCCWQNTHGRMPLEHRSAVYIDNKGSFLAALHCELQIWHQKWKFFWCFSSYAVPTAPLMSIISADNHNDGVGCLVIIHVGIQKASMLWGQ